MKKTHASILILLALFVLGHAQELQRLTFDQGRLRMRNLASSSSSLNSYKTTNYSGNSGVRVNLGSTYLKSIGLNDAAQTDMLILLYTNTTAFCGDCTGDFVSFTCAENSCGYDTTQPQSHFSPFYSMMGYPFSFSTLTVGSGSSSSWKLKTTALYYSSSDREAEKMAFPGAHERYFRSNLAYGFIGLGVGGNAYNNFQTPNPIFSLQVSTNGAGSLIFGKDTALYDNSLVPQIFPTDSNWTMTSRNMTFGPYISRSDYSTQVIFDLQYPGISLSRPKSSFADLWEEFAKRYNIITNDTFKKDDFRYFYKGSLSNLPTLVIGLTDDLNITLPPSAYTKKVGDVYILLLSYSDTVKNMTSRGSVEYTILGWPVLSQFYTVFEQKPNAQPTVTLHPTYNATENGVVIPKISSSSSTFTIIAIITAIILIALVAIFTVLKKRTQVTKSDLGVELNTSRIGSRH